MSLRITPGTVQGTLDAPPSKSHTHRAFVLAALSGNGSVRRALQSQDTLATLECLQRLGYLVSDYPHEVRVGGQLRPGRDPLDAKESGTTLRLMCGLASLADRPVRLTGAPRLRQRPLGPLLEALGELGVRASSDADGWTLTGPQKGGHARLAGNTSSQFVSAILLSAPMAARPTRLEIIGPQSSRPYVDITLAQLRHHGVKVERSDSTFEVLGPQTVRQRPYTVPGDYSSAAFVLAAAAVTRGDVTVRGLIRDDPQGDRAIVEHLRAFGASVDVTEEAVRVRGTGGLESVDIDVGQTPDLFPVLCALAAVARGTSVLRGAPHLRDKESDRIHAMAENLRAAGVALKERDDGIQITGAIPKGITIQSFGDHRIAMACEVLALAAQGASILPDENVVGKSYPNFHNDLLSVAAQVARQ